MKKMLIVGELGYHEKNITQNIIKNIKKNYKIDRLGGNFDFFIPENYKSIIDNYFKSIPVSLKEYDIVFFMDYWNMIMPLFMYKKSIENLNCVFASLYHGSVLFKDDVANEIINSVEYEKYLHNCFDYIFVNYDWIKKMHNYQKNMFVTIYPFDEQLKRKRPNLNYSKNIYFIHRFHEDKGCNKFLKFLEYCKIKNKLQDFNFYVFDNEPKNFKWKEEYLNLKFLGRQNQKYIKKFVSRGGYAWSSVKSETLGYGILDLISYGITPILNNHLAYKSLYPKKFIYNSFDDIIYKIQKRIKFTEKDWQYFKKWYSKEFKVYDFLNGISKK